jgi:hypothetical protein
MMWLSDEDRERNKAFSHREYCSMCKKALQDMYFTLNTKSVGCGGSSQNSAGYYQICSCCWDNRFRPLFK